VANTIIAGSYDGPAVSCENNSDATLTCCDLYDNSGGDWVGCIADQLGVDGNISADPLFTDHIWGDFTISPAIFASILDMPDDQGGEVRIRFYRNVFDDTAETGTPLLSYGVWRRVVDGKARHALSSGEETTHVNRSEFGGLPLRAWKGRYFLAKSDLDSVGYFPPGDWEALHSIPAVQQNSYQTVAATLGDSTAAGNLWTDYCISAHTTTPSLWWASLPDSGYSVDNIAPAVPGGFVLGPGDQLGWDASPEPDFQYFSVYGSTVDQLDGSATLIAHTLDTSLDVAGLSHEYFLLTSTDHAGNQSAAAVVDAVVGLDDRPASRFVLHPCTPNPFNPRTRIVYDLPVASCVRLEVYDLSGRRIRILIDDQQRSGGRHEAVWRGEGDDGRAVAAGVYFYRLAAGDFTQTRRMTLVK